LDAQQPISPAEILGLDQLPLTLTVAQAAKLVGVSRPTMYRAIEQGDFPHLKVSGRIVVPTTPLLTKLGVPHLTLQALQT